MTIVECVPNVSEGRSLANIDAMAGAVARIEGVRLLHRSSDADHNRSVFTYAGEPAAVVAATAALFAVAVAVIDLRTHRGEHPRIGAVDVVPFVPLGETPMRACVALARDTGAMVAERFGIPVYLYEEAARSPERRKLENIRRGGFEQLAARMSTPAWKPDFGPAAPHPTAGATAIGARRALVAYNINLATADVNVAKTIAARVRESGGGLPSVKAIGLTLARRGIVQVSMNLTNYEVTPLERVFDRVAGEAARMGVEIVESELIGLVPAAALAGTTPEHLRLRDFSSDRILENRLAAAGLVGETSG